jgi:hypothetical protein
MIKVTFVAKEPGVYKILWSNSHSWFKAKSLHYRILVLSPVNENENSTQFESQNEMLISTRLSA